MQIPLIVAVIVTCLVTGIILTNWRYGLLAVIPIGLLQDILRKLTPGIPAYYILWSSAIFALVVVVAFSATSSRVRLLWFDNSRLKTSFDLFLLLVLVQCLHSFIRWGHPALPVFGLLFYCGPLAVLLTVIVFASQPIWIKRLVTVYLWVMVPACLTVFCSPLFKDSFPILKEVGDLAGKQMVIYDMGAALYSYSGLFRVGEVAAFHAATCAAFLTMLILHKKSTTLKRIGMSVLIALLIGAIILTGRRKMLMALSIFWVVQLFLFTVLRKGRTRLAVTFLLLATVLITSVGVLDTGESSLYLHRGGSVFSSVEKRASIAVNLFASAVRRSDGIGLGAGVASQGARYAGIDNSKSVGGASESGIGLLAIELGIPGILILGWFFFNLIKIMWQNLKFVATVHESLLLYAVSFSSLLIANFATFLVATQLYGDFFVLIVLGMVAGLLYAVIYHAAIAQRSLSQNSAGKVTPELHALQQNRVEC